MVARQFRLLQGLLFPSRITHCTHLHLFAFRLIGPLKKTHCLMILLLPCGCWFLPSGHNTYEGTHDTKARHVLRCEVFHPPPHPHLEALAPNSGFEGRALEMISAHRSEDPWEDGADEWAW